MSYLFFIIDAFTSGSFKGNPAAVVLLDEPKSDTWLQAIAAEFNLSETAFLWALDHVDHQQAKRFQLRWFTPSCEVKLCGHATLASAQALSKNLGNPHTDFVFTTLSGELKASLEGDKIALSLPQKGISRLSNIFSQDPASGIQALDLTIVGAYQAEDYLLLELETESQVAGYVPNFNLLSQIQFNGIILTAASRNPNIDFVSRFFAPRLGVNEDPVTGSAHCALAPFWANKLTKKYLRATQVSQRGGYLEMELVDGDVELRGQCKTFAEGNLK